MIDTTPKDFDAFKRFLSDGPRRCPNLYGPLPMDAKQRAAGDVDKAEVSEEWDAREP